MMGNYRPEIIALAGLFISILARICEAYNIHIGASDAIQLSAGLCWIISRFLRKYLPDENARDIKEIKKNIIQNTEENIAQPTIESIIPAKIMAESLKEKN